MKTQKQLPNQFTFICDKHSKEQLQKLGVESGGLLIDVYSDLYYVKDNNVYPSIVHAPLINLADYLDQEQPEAAKWRFKTKEEFDNTCEKDINGYYICGKTHFVDSMFNFFGKKYAGSPDNLIMHNGWNISPEMLMPLDKQPEQKWQPLTRGGYEYVIYDYFDNRLFGRVKGVNKEWHRIDWDLDGRFGTIYEDSWDLLPINNELTTLEKELEEVRSKEKEILEKIEQLKTK